MAPQNKRQAQSKSPEEVCKRLKEERQSENTNNNKTEQKSHNNNYDDSNNDNIKLAADPKSNGVKLESEKVITNNDEKQTNQSKAETKDKATAILNGEQKVKAENLEDGEDKKQSTSGSSNGKNEEQPQKTSTSESDSKTATLKTPEPEEEPTGTLLICGGANWDMTGRKELPKTAKKPAEVNTAARNLWAAHKVCLEGSSEPLRVKGVFSGCNACHSVIVTDDGLTMTFGRNDKGQLGLGDTETRITPTVVEALRGINVVAAACGRSHTLFLDSDGIVYSCGDNKMGQCGTNQMAVQQITTPTRIAFKENKPIVRLACGAEFSMIVDIDGKLYSFGHPEHGQLGHNSEGKYFTSGNKFAFHCEYQPRRIVTFIEKSRDGHVSSVDDVQIVDIACGTNHTLAVDKRGRCYSWGFGGYHRLGHSETKVELVPRSIKVFDAPNNAGRGAVKVFAGASHSMALDVNGLLYFWGQNKSSGEATMYPKNVQDLCGFRLRAVACANRSIFVIADDICVSWGPSPTYGELGYGEGKSKSSTVPQEVKPLEGIHVIDVACGFGHTLLIGRDKSEDEKTALSKFKSWP